MLQRLHDRGFGKFLSRLGVDTLARESFTVERVESYLECQAAPVRRGLDRQPDHLEVAGHVAAACHLQLLPREPSQLPTAMRRPRTTNPSHARGLSKSNPNEAPRAFEAATDPPPRLSPAAVHNTAFSPGRAPQPACPLPEKSALPGVYLTADSAVVAGI